MTIVGFLLISRATLFLNRIRAFSRHSPLVLFGNLISLMIGIIIIVFHNQWVMQWCLVITLLGWCLIIRSIIYLFFPALVPKIVSLFKTTTPIYILGLISLTIGLFLAIHGFLG